MLQDIQNIVSLRTLCLYGWRKTLLLSQHPQKFNIQHKNNSDFERHAHICYVHTPNNPLCFVFFSCPKSPKLIRIIWRSPHITSYFLTLINVTHTKTRPPQLMLIFSNQQQKVSMMSMTNLSLKTFNEF